MNLVLELTGEQHRIRMEVWRRIMKETERGLCVYGLSHNASNPYTDKDQDATYCPHVQGYRTCGECPQYRPPAKGDNAPPMPGMVEY